MSSRVPGTGATEQTVRLSWSWRWAGAFAALVLTLHEGHELAHTWLGRLVCGGWGERDFNTWSLAEGCVAVTPTLAGPLFTYAVLWVGAAMVGARSRSRRHGGVALLFASNPFSRILTVGLGGGDELVVAARLAGGGATVPLWLGTLVLVLLVTLPALWLGWRALRATPRRWLWFLGLFLGPTVFVILSLLVVLSALLTRGVGATPVILGEPILVLAVSLAVFVIVGFTHRWLVPPAD